MVLAAGVASRFGSPKALATLGGRRLIDHALDACGEHETVVVGSAVVAGVIAARRGRKTVVNDRPERGMNHSIKLALEHVPVERSVAILLADMPFVDRALVDLLIGLMTPEIDVCYPTYNGTPGHPVIFGWRTRHRLEALETGDGIRSVRDAPEFRRWTVALTDPRASRDIDTPADLEAAGDSP